MTSNRQELSILINGRRHGAFLAVPRIGACGIVIFVHGSGSSRFSPRNQRVALQLEEAGLATLLFDLLDEREAAREATKFNISLLTDRVAGAVDWVKTRNGLSELPIGYFGASTGAAAALTAAARSPGQVQAIVSRGGRPDLAFAMLPMVNAATLLIVGSEDQNVLKLNKKAYEQLSCQKELVVVPGATHLFAEPGALEKVANYATNWFIRHLTAMPAEADKKLSWFG